MFFCHCIAHLYRTVHYYAGRKQSNQNGWDGYGDVRLRLFFQGYHMILNKPAVLHSHGSDKRDSRGFQADYTQGRSTEPLRVI